MRLKIGVPACKGIAGTFAFANLALPLALWSEALGKLRVLEAEQEQIAHRHDLPALVAERPRPRLQAVPSTRLYNAINVKRPADSIGRAVPRPEEIVAKLRQVAERTFGGTAMQAEAATEGLFPPIKLAPPGSTAEERS